MENSEDESWTRIIRRKYGKKCIEFALYALPAALITSGLFSMFLLFVKPKADDDVRIVLGKCEKVLHTISISSAFLMLLVLEIEFGIVELCKKFRTWIQKFFCRSSSKSARSKRRPRRTRPLRSDPIEIRSIDLAENIDSENPENDPCGPLHPNPDILQSSELSRLQPDTEMPITRPLRTRRRSTGQQEQVDFRPSLQIPIPAESAELPTASAAEMPTARKKIIPIVSPGVVLGQEPILRRSQRLSISRQSSQEEILLPGQVPAMSDQATGSGESGSRSFKTEQETHKTKRRKSLPKKEFRLK